MNASKSLPVRPSHESLRKQAKKLARDIAAGDTEAIARARVHLPHVDVPVTHRNAQLVIAREYGFPGWQDLLAEVSRTVAPLTAARKPVLVGFAAETGSLERAAAKLAAKGVDLLVANDVAEAGSGFGTDTNRVSILDAAGARDDLPLLSKREVADRLLDRIAAALDARDLAAQTAESMAATAAAPRSTNG